MASFPISPAFACGDGHIGPVPVISSPRLRTLGPGPTVLVVGYPAPAAVRVVDRLLATDTRTIACVVSRAQWVHACGTHRSAQVSGRIRLFEGTADAPGLGLACTAWRILDTTDEIYAAASADSIARGHLHDFADECPWLRDLHFVEDTPEGPPPPSTSRRSRLRRFLPSRSTLSMRFSIEKLAAALGLVGIALAAPLVIAAGPWKDLMDFDLDMVLSQDDLEHDLWTRRLDQAA